MNERQQDLFDRAVKGHSGLHWQLRIDQVVRSLAESIEVPETENWNNDFAATLDLVDKAVRKMNVSALEVVSDHQEKTGDDDHKMIDEIIKFYDRNDNIMGELFYRLEDSRERRAAGDPPSPS